jgi:hypothetical protein
MMEIAIQAVEWVFELKFPSVKTQELAHSAN